MQLATWSTLNFHSLYKKSADVRDSGLNRVPIPPWLTYVMDVCMEKCGARVANKGRASCCSSVEET